MNAVTMREAGPDLASLIEEVQGGRDVILTRDGVPVARVVKEVSRSTWTPERQQALEETRAVLSRGWPLGIEKLDREELYDDTIHVRPPG
jgi:prevent-host-death family protein